MSPIYWDESFNVGHAEVDLQHRKFMTIMNEMESLLLVPDTYTRLPRLNILARLLEFADNHFRLEQELMQKYGCSDTSLCNHWRSHKIFDANIYGLYRELLGGETVLDSTILGVIRDEFFNHILRQDKMMFQNVFADIAGRFPMEIVSENVLSA